MPVPAIRSPALKRKLAAQVAPDVEDDAELADLAVESADWSEKTLRGVELDSVELAKSSLSGSHWNRLRWLDVRCTATDFSNVEWEEATVARVEFIDCRLVGAKLDRCKMEHVRFVRCQLSYAAFLSTQFRFAAFEECSMIEAQFHGSNLEDVPFLRWDLSNADFANAKLGGADVSTSTIQGIRIGANEVRGLGATREQAAALAVLLGIRIVS